jgi:peptidoglycan/LPS O-acetylase OafA/YrhL
LRTWRSQYSSGVVATSAAQCVTPAPLPAARGLAIAQGAGKARLAGVEWLRLIASLGIVAFHSGVQPSSLFISGLYAFALFTVALAATSARGRRWGEYAAARLRSLGLPWLAWSVVFAGVETAYATINDRAPFSWFKPWMLWTGPSLHLWFLPFALAASLVAGWWGSRHPDMSGRSWVWWSLLGAALMIPLSVTAESREWPIPVGQWLSVLPAVPLGIAFASIPAGRPAGSRPLVLISAGALLAGVWGAASGHDALTPSYALAVPACALAWRLPLRAGRITLAWSSLSFGVYLIHPLMNMVFHKFFESDDPVLIAVAVSAMSLAGAWVLKRTPARGLL